MRLRRLAALTFSTLVMAFLFISSVGLSEAFRYEIVRYVDGRWVCADGTVLKLRPMRGQVILAEFRTPDGLVMSHQKYLELCGEEKIARAEKYTLFDPKTGDKWVIVYIKPELMEVKAPISGFRLEGTARRYGPYSSCVQVGVSVTWEPSDQVLGIAVADAETGEGRVYWCTGGSATVVFGVDWTRHYHVYILNQPDNTETITYDGVIRLYIW